MTARGTLLIGRALLAAALVSLAAPAIGAAQGGPGFLFKQPVTTLKFETGYGLQLASGDVFDFTREQLTVGRRDFDAAYLGAELAIRITERWDVALGVGWQRSSKASEFRDWVDGDDNPIEQVTELRVAPFTVTGKYYFQDRGRSVGRFAWVPNTFSPYVGAGVGVASYRFSQEGDFVDFETLDIFFDRLMSEGQVPLVRGVAGISVSVGKQFEISGEGRYSYASADLSSDFDDFGAMDLDGFQAVFGLAVRF